MGLLTSTSPLSQRDRNVSRRARGTAAHPEAQRGTEGTPPRQPRSSPRSLEPWLGCAPSRQAHDSVREPCRPA